MKCPQCQHENRPQARFCEQCGSLFAGIIPTVWSDAGPKSEVESLRQALAEALEQQAATAEILCVIASSFEEADRARRLHVDPFYNDLPRRQAVNARATRRPDWLQLPDYWLARRGCHR